MMLASFPPARRTSNVAPISAILRVALALGKELAPGQTEYWLGSALRSRKTIRRPTPVKCWPQQVNPGIVQSKHNGDVHMWRECADACQPQAALVSWGRFQSEANHR
jgi:hypothetical protein